MEESLKNKVYQYISENNPDLLLSLQENNKTTSYINKKVGEVGDLINELSAANTPAYIVEEVCMDALTKDLRPSKYNYISNILEEEFEFAYLQFKKSGTLLYEVLNLLNQCEPYFEALGFTEENEDKKELYYAVTGTIDKYLSK